MIRNLLVWNVRGLRHSRGQLKQLVRKNNVVVVAVLEPFQEATQMTKLTIFLGFPHFCCNAGVDGKVWVLWKEGYDFVCSSLTDQSSWLTVENFKLLVSFVCAKCTRSDRRGLWHELNNIYLEMHPWVVLEDFNII